MDGNTSRSDEVRMRDEVLRLLDMAAQASDAVLPSGTVGLSYGQRLGSMLFFSCRGLFAGIHRLLDTNLAVEAEVLLRTLIEDSIVLTYLAGNRSTVEELALRYEYRLVDKEIGLRQAELAAAKADVESGRPNAARHLEIAQENLAEAEASVEEYRQAARDLGMTRLERLPPPEELLLLMEQSRGRVIVQRAHRFVHTSRISLSRRVTESPAGLELRISGTPRELIRTGCLVPGVYLAATESLLRLLGRDDGVEAIRKQRDRIDERTSAIMRAINVLEDAEAGRSPT